MVVNIGSNIFYVLNPFVSIGTPTPPPKKKTKMSFSVT